MQRLLGAACLMLALCGLLTGLAVVSRPHVNTERSAMSRLFSTVVAAPCLTAPVGKADAEVLAFEKAYTSGDIAAVDALHDGALTSIDAALACSPASGDLWMAGARLIAMREGLTPKAIAYLRMSCLTSPTIAFDAKGRLILMTGQADALPADLKACMTHDLALLAQAATRRTPA